MNYKKTIRKISQLIARYPLVTSVSPAIFARMFGPKFRITQGPLLTIESVQDRYYFLLFGALSRRLQFVCPHRVSLIVTGSINGSVGVGFLSLLKRSFLINRLRNAPWIRAYGDNIDEVGYRSASLMNPFLEAKFFLKSRLIWNKVRYSFESFDLYIDGIKVDDLIIDSFIRFKPSHKFTSSDRFVRTLIWQALRDTYKARRYFVKNQPKWYFTSYTTYLEHGIPARVAESCGVKVWSFANLNRPGKLVVASDTYHTINYSDFRAIFESYDNKSLRLAQAEEQLRVRLSGGIDIGISYMRSSAYQVKRIELPIGIKNSVVVFLHDFFDSPHAYPDLVFHDFWSWITFTIDHLHKYKINFYLKPHPNQISEGAYILDELSKKYPGLQWLPDNVSNSQLADAGIICGITVYGTVAHELAYLGVYSICCARHPHHSFQFCKTARDRAEYANYIKNVIDIPITKCEMKNQALAFYYMQNLHDDSSDSDLHNAYLNLWLACNTGSFDEIYIENTLKNLISLPGFDHFVNQIYLSIL